MVGADGRSPGRGHAAGDGCAQPAARGGGRSPRRPAAAGGTTRRRGRHAPVPLQRAVGKQGGLTPLLFAAREGTRMPRRAARRGRRRQPASAGDKTSPLLMATINGHFDLAKWLLDRGADPNLASDNGVTPLYAALNVQWAPRGALSAAAAAPAAEAHVSRVHEGAARQGRRPERAPDEEGLVHRIQLRSRRASTRSARRRSGAPPAGDVEAMKLLVAKRRRPEHPDDASGRPAALGDAGGARSVRTCRACRRFRRAARRAAAAGRRRRRLRRRLRRQLAHSRAGGLDAGGQVSRRGAGRRRQRRAITTATPRCTTPRRAATTR